MIPLHPAPMQTTLMGLQSSMEKSPILYVERGDVPLLDTEAEPASGGVESVFFRKMLLYARENILEKAWGREDDN